MNGKRLELKRIEHAVIALLITVVLLTIAYFKGAEANAKILHRQEVKYGLQVILNALERGESGRAAYVSEIGQLTSLIGDEPAQMVRLNQIDSLANLQLAGDAEGKYYIDRIRAETNLMLVGEDRLVAGYEANFTFWRYAIAVLLLISILTLLRGLFSLYQRIEPLIYQLEATKESLERANRNIAETLYKLKKEHGEISEDNLPASTRSEIIEDTHFYKKMRHYARPLEALLADSKLFVAVPEDWFVLVLDVESSTQAVKNGLHHEVNLAATGSIVAVMNTLRTIDASLEIPYFFGGDGVTFLLPPSVVPKMEEVLENYRHHVRRNMYLSLKVGTLRVSEVYRSGRRIDIAKSKVSPHLILPIVLGTGLKNAEREIKSYFMDETVSPAEIPEIDLQGMECRWDEVPPPLDTQRVICLVAECKTDGEQGKVYAAILERINQVFGPPEQWQPISTSRLKLDLNLSKVRKEMYARIGRMDVAHLIRTWFSTLIGPAYFRFSDEGKAYLNQISEQATTIMIDGTFNCVISGTAAQTQQLTSFLDGLEVEGKLLYGIHETHASVMSCYVQDRKDKHVHFVDGTEGGYTTAARMFKAKLLTDEPATP